MAVVNEGKQTRPVSTPPERAAPKEPAHCICSKCSAKSTRCPRSADGVREHDAAIAQAAREKVLKTIREMRSPDFGRFALKQRNATLEEVIEQLNTESAPLLNPEQERP